LAIRLNIIVVRLDVILGVIINYLKQLLLMLLEQCMISTDVVLAFHTVYNVQMISHAIFAIKQIITIRIIPIIYAKLAMLFMVLNVTDVIQLNVWLAFFHTIFHSPHVSFFYYLANRTCEDCNTLTNCNGCSDGPTCDTCITGFYHDLSKSISYSYLANK